MTKFKDRLKSRLQENRGDSNTISLLFSVVILCMFTITILDMGMYNADRNAVIGATQNGARLAAIYGGVGDGNEGTPIAQAYGASDTSDCTMGKNPVTCAVERELRAAGLTNGVVKSIDCGPGKTPEIGDRTYCEVKWLSKGLPGSAMSFIQRNPENVTKQTAESEVIVK